MPRFPLKLLLFILTIVGVAATAAHWLWARPSEEEIAHARQVRELRGEFSEIPTTLGRWRRVAPDGDEILMADGAVLLRRQYEHIESLARVEVLLYGGHMKHVTRLHFLDCFDNHEWLGTKEFAGDDPTQPYSCKAWINQNEPTPVLWMTTVTKNGDWSNTEDERLSLGFTRRCFKLVLTTEIASDESVDEAINRTDDLHQQFIPAANRILFETPKRPNR